MEPTMPLPRLSSSPGEGSIESPKGQMPLCGSHPYLSEGADNYAIDIYEVMPVPFEA
jgi:hypothetical protein